MFNPIIDQCNMEYFDISNPHLIDELKSCIHERLSLLNPANDTLILLCIGTDRATGDWLGPLVGEKLCKKKLCCDIYGTLNTPVHALNLSDTIKYIRNSYDHPFIIAIDAALGHASHVGYITVSNCPMAPGKGVNKKLPIIGDMSITGIVNVSGKHEGILQSTRLYTVMTLADSIADALLQCLS